MIEITITQKCNGGGNPISVELYKQAFEEFPHISDLIVQINSLAKVKVRKRRSDSGKPAKKRKAEQTDKLPFQSVSGLTGGKPVSGLTGGKPVSGGIDDTF
jgi:hypothetical protein